MPNNNNNEVDNNGLNTGVNAEEGNPNLPNQNIDKIVGSIDNDPPPLDQPYSSTLSFSIERNLSIEELERLVKEEKALRLSLGQTGGVIDNKLSVLRRFLTEHPNPSAHIPISALRLTIEAGLLNEITQPEKNIIDQINKLDKNHTISYADALGRMGHSTTFLTALESIYNLPVGHPANGRSRSKSRSKSRSGSRRRSRRGSRRRSGTRHRISNN
jgi:hypothetical protein